MNAPSFVSVGRALAALALVGLLAGCPQVPAPDPLPASPSVSEFKTSATQVTAGSTVTLSWKVENATSVRIDELSLGSVSGVSANEGTVEVSVSRDSTYVLSVRNDRGASDSAVVSVRVGGSAREPLLVAVPESITAGQSSTIAWTAPNAASVTLTAAPGGAVDVGGQSSSGSVTVSPTLTTEYTLTANGQSRKVTVAVAPSISTLTASNLVNDAGSTIQVSWATVGATRLQLNGVGRGPLADITDAARIATGSFEEPLPTSADPGQFFTYELVATGASGSTTRTVVFGIPGNPAVTSFTGPAIARSGADAGVMTLAWQTVEAASVTIAAGGTEFYRAPSTALASGTLQVPVPAQDTEYVLTARAYRGGEATARLTVDVVHAPTVSLSASPATVAAGSPVTLSWTGTDIRNVVIREQGYGTVFTATGMQDTGSAQLYPNGDVTYVIDVDNSLGDSATAMTQVTVTSPVTLTLSETGSLRFGQTVNITASAPGDIVGLPHDTVQVRTGSTAFDDISMTGTTLAFPLTAEAAVITTNFRMPYFGRLVGESIKVSRHGFLGFSDVNGSNSIDEALPTAYLEDLVIAPYWEALTLGTVRWQLKGSTLIVQWNMGTSVFQTRLHTSGQIDFDYSALPTTPAGRVGVTGVVREQTIVAPSAAAVGTGFTFFGARAQPVPVKAWAVGTLQGEVVAGGGSVRVTAAIADVVRPGELALNEALTGSAGGANGTWVELRNSRTTAVELAGWSFTLTDGGVLPLSGTVPPRGVYVVGATTDPVLNGDAGVQLAVTNFDLGGEAQLSLSRGGVASTLPLAGSDGGTAIVNDVGPYRFSSGAAQGPSRCAATATYGSWGHRGTPGADSHCGFGYDLVAIAPGYFDISDGGTPLMSSTNGFDDALATVSLTAAPVPFFGVNRTSMSVSTNGFVAFDAAAGDDYLGIDPSTSNTNLLVAAFTADLTTSVGQVYAQRVGAGVDPSAPAPHWIVQWHRYAVYLCSSDLNFQLKFFDDGVVEVHYGRLLSTTSDQCAADALSTSWLENAAGTQALTVSSRSNNLTPGIRPYTAFRFSPR